MDRRRSEQRDAEGCRNRDGGDREPADGRDQRMPPSPGGSTRRKVCLQWFLHVAFEDRVDAADAAQLEEEEHCKAG